MEISPIPGIRVLPLARAKPVDPELSAVFEIEAAGRPADDSFSRQVRKAAGAEESDEDAESMSQQPEQEEPGQQEPEQEEHQQQQAQSDFPDSQEAPDPAHPAAPNRISFFA